MRHDWGLVPQSAQPTEPSRGAWPVRARRRSGRKTKARSSRAMPCKSRQREGRRERGPVQSVHEGAIPRAHSNAVLGYGPINAGSEIGEKHLDPSEAVTLRGAAVEADLRLFHFATKRSPASSKQCKRRPGCSGDVRGGALAITGESFARALPAHTIETEAKASLYRVARWLSGYPPALANSQSQAARRQEPGDA